ncbi:MAG TPA: DUF2301 domain-containing membrane protein [Oscillatoriaceae cyanobacterium M33_DOE_052]|uniref:DUF2301 domain-containing membrane protein n=1 Tax=Planktothricoides sp. SpSt-374 TaxID=2282167 RepID=A0A7C3VGQ3_9CYAN|nr:DUF2301 domain-containing membrane protein [Oscillatoriaceae cyanobacterium M33_DOE_052]
MAEPKQLEPEVYQGQFGEFTITQSDRTGVQIYRTGLMVAAIAFATGTALVLWRGNDSGTIALLTPLYACFCLALGVSLVTIHIYLAILHRLLQAFWLIGAVAAVALNFHSQEPLAIAVTTNTAALLAIGFTFAALTGIYFKEAFCFDRLETKILTPLVPLLILGHLFGLLSPFPEKLLLATWAGLFLIFALRKTIQPIPADIGDKSVFEHLKSRPRVASELAE